MKKMIRTLMVLSCVSGLLLTGCGGTEPTETQNTAEPTKLVEQGIATDETKTSETKVETSTKGKISIVTDPWFPYTGKEGKDEMHGLIVEVPELIFTKAGYEVEYKNLPWERCISEVENGKYNIIASADKNEAPDLIAPEETSGTYKNSLFTLKGKEFNYDSVESIKSKKFVCIDGYEYSDEINEYVDKKPENVRFVAGDEPLNNMIELVKSGRADVFIDDKNVVKNKLTAMNLLDSFVEIPLPGDPGDLYILFSPKIEKSKEYAKIFDDGIREMRKNGELQKILDKYKMKDWKK